MEHKAYYAVIPANVRYNRRLTDGAKLLFGEITALCDERGFCWATNKYFADLYDVAPETVSRWVSSLIREGFIKVDFKATSGNGTERKIYLTHGLSDLLTKISSGVDENVKTPTAKTSSHNKDNSNNISLVKNKKASQASPAPQKRGTRLPENWYPTSELIDWAMKNVPLLATGHGSTDRLSRETVKFKNHWESATGRNATKLNWDKAWQNWMYTAEERLGKGEKSDTASAGRAYIDKLRKGGK